MELRPVYYEFRHRRDDRVSLGIDSAHLQRKSIQRVGIRPPHERAYGPGGDMVFTTRIDLDELLPSLRAGMSVEVTFEEK